VFTASDDESFFRANSAGRMNVPGCTKSSFKRPFPSHHNDHVRGPASSTIATELSTAAVGNIPLFPSAKAARIASEFGAALTSHFDSKLRKTYRFISRRHYRQWTAREARQSDFFASLGFLRTAPTAAQQFQQRESTGQPIF